MEPADKSCYNKHHGQTGDGLGSLVDDIGVESVSQWDFLGVWWDTTQTTHKCNKKLNWQNITSFNIVIFNKSYSCPSSSLAPTHTWYPRDERLATGTLGPLHWIERLWTRANVWPKDFSANILYDFISTLLIWLGLGELREVLQSLIIATLLTNQ